MYTLGGFAKKNMSNIFTILCCYTFLQFCVVTHFYNFVLLQTILRMSDCTCNTIIAHK